MQTFINDPSVKRIWLGDQRAIDQTRLFQRVVNIEDISNLKNATMEIFADNRYLLWINGMWISRGPVMFLPEHPLSDHHDILQYLRKGTNIVSVAVHNPGYSLHNYIATGRPGLSACIILEPQNGKRLLIPTDKSWCATEQAGWHTDTKKRNWALAAIEWFDANRAPANWLTDPQNDPSWADAEEHCAWPGGIVCKQADLPPLAWSLRSPTRLLTQARVSGELFAPTADCKQGSYGYKLFTETWSEPGTETALLADGTLSIPATGADGGLALSLDLGALFTGHVTFEMDAESRGTVDIGTAEDLRDGRPTVLRHSVSYVNRYDARLGRQSWITQQFTACRYLLLVFRNFSGRVRLSKFGLLSSEPAVKWCGTCVTTDTRLTDIADICARTLRIGTQETMMDCTSREQALYVGDGILTGIWFARNTGNWRHLQYLLQITFLRQADSGLVMTTPLSGRVNILLDYNLLTVIGVLRYLKETGDADFIRPLVPACRRIIDWFRSRVGKDGLLDLRAELADTSRNDGWLPPGSFSTEALNNPGMDVFIDHAGMGWHNIGEPGIDRRGINAGIHALFTWAMRAQCELERSVGTDAETLEPETENLAAAGARFWNQSAKAFADGILDGNLLPQISQQTNVYYLLAGVTPPIATRTLIERLLDPADKQIARCGSWFWSWLLDVMVQENMCDIAIPEIIRLWGPMVDHGGGTVWETFNGDDRDSLSHPWSAGPLDFLQRHIAGIGFAPRNARTIELRPRFDILPDLEVRLCLPAGDVHIAWKTSAGTVELTGTLPDNIDALLILPNSSRHSVSGQWSLKI